MAGLIIKQLNSINELGNAHITGSQVFKNLLTETYTENQEQDVLTKVDLNKMIADKEVRLAQGTSHLFAAYINDELAGFSLWSELKPPSSSLDFIYVYRNHRGRSLSQNLLDAGIEALKVKGLNLVNLNVSKFNLTAQKFYTKHGWTNEGQNPKYPSALRFTFKF